MRVASFVALPLMSLALGAGFIAFLSTAANIGAALLTVSHHVAFCGAECSTIEE